ncbi:DMT family transporter [Raoultella sp. BAC10a-01-01]|uniref:DMT family transporter n=1 Tax=Raoultella scottii TaxID=3040937 RepID=A0ABU8Z023_9ENTR
MNPIISFFRQSEHSRKGLAGIGFGLIAATIWGAFIAVSRQGIGAGLQAADLAFLRYLSAGLILLPWLLRQKISSLAGIGWSRGLLLSFLAGPAFVMVGASGYLFAPLAHGAVIQLGTLTLLTVVLATCLLKEPLGLQRVTGVLILISGLIVTAGPTLFQTGSSAWRGDILFACAGAMWALFSILMRRWQVNALAATAVVSVLSALIYTPLWLIFASVQHLQKVPLWLVIEQVIVQGILSGVVALFCFSRAVNLLGASRAALFPALAPGAAMLIGIPLTGDIPTAMQILGLVIISCGLLVTVIKWRK